MPRLPLVLARALALTLATAWPCAGAAPRPPAAPMRAHTDDGARRIDANRINLFVSNRGNLGYDPDNAAALGGLYYPRGSSGAILFDAGLWLGGTIAGVPRVTVAEYSSEYAPGAMPDGIPDDPAGAEHVVYKVARWTGNPADSAHLVRGAAELAADPHADPIAHHSWSEYMSGAVGHGAPWRMYRLPNTATPAPDDSLDVPGPDVRGDQMLWCVFNEGDPARHTNQAGGSAPLGVEVRQTVFAYDRPGPLGNTVFVRWDIFNRGANRIPDLRAAIWADPDIGSFTDDLVGCDTTRSLGYGYNVLWSGGDTDYGAAIPALGFDLLARDMQAFTRYIGGTDPSSTSESWNYMQGRNTDGSEIRDPASTPTRFMHTGDPLLETGWVDRYPADRRLMAASGPHEVAPGDSLTFWVALVVGQGQSPAASLRALRCADDQVQEVFDAGFVEPFAAPLECEIASATNCPRNADWWAAQCATGGQFSAAQWTAIARWADSTSAVFTFAGPNEAVPYCAVLGANATARDSSHREYLAILSNVAAGRFGLLPADGKAIGLSLETGVVAPPLLGTLVAGLLRGPPLVRATTEAAYINGDFLNVRALAGVNVGLAGFSGGAGPAWDLLGGKLNPATMPDSFTAVELRFSHTATQKAYRFFRLQQSDGLAPNPGRAYKDGGFHTVNLQAWDIVNNQQLDIAFVEKMVTAADGTYLPLSAQPASQDSTWDPSDNPDGDHEYLFVLRRPYSPSPKPSITVSGTLANNEQPLLWALAANLRSADAVIDDGDGFRFDFGWPRTSSAEALLAGLETAAPTDTAARRLRRELATGLRDLNLGLGIGPVCGRATPFAVTLVEASVVGMLVTLRWRLGEPTSSARIESRSASGVWLDYGPVTLEQGVEAVGSFYDYSWPPMRHAYRLVASTATGIARSDSVWIDLPGDPVALALTGVWPNPAHGAQRVSFTLPLAGAASLEVFDLNGRRTYGRELGTLAAGLHHVQIAPVRPLRPGVYFLVLRYGAQRRTARFVTL